LNCIWIGFWICLFIFLVDTWLIVEYAQQHSFPPFVKSLSRNQLLCFIYQIIPQKKFSYTWIPSKSHFYLLSPCNSDNNNNNFKVIVTVHVSAECYLFVVLIIASCYLLLTVSPWCGSFVCLTCFRPWLCGGGMAPPVHLTESWLYERKFHHYNRIITLSRCRNATQCKSQSVCCCW
jgi:hypothetical protein